MNILRSIGFVAVMGLVGLGGIRDRETRGGTGLPGCDRHGPRGGGAPAYARQRRGCGASHGASLFERRL
jgi:hypothetical protein